MNKTSKLQNPKELAYIISQEGVIEILKFIDKNGFARYRDLKEIIKSQATLSRRVVEMCSLGILRREQLDDRLRFIKYSLTEKGNKILKLIVRMENEFKEI